MVDDELQGAVGPVERREIPRPQIHERLGAERRGVEVVRITLHQVAHGVGVRGIVRGAIGARHRVIALRERRDVRALRLARRRCERLRALRERIRARLRLGAHRHVDVRPEHQRLAPVRHGACRVEPGRLAERSAGLVVIERVGEAEPLVEIFLSHGALGRHLVVERAEPAIERRRSGPGRRASVIVLGRGGGEREEKEQRGGEAGANHRLPPEILAVRIWTRTSVEG